MKGAVAFHTNTNTHTKQMNKNAYEIRLELLQLAHGDIMTQYHETLNCQKEAIYQGGKETSDLSQIDVSLPPVSAVIERAEQFYKFIEKQ